MLYKICEKEQCNNKAVKSVVHPGGGGGGCSEVEIQILNNGYIIPDRKLLKRTELDTNKRQTAV